MDSFDFAFIPYFVEPAPHQFDVFVDGHERSPFEWFCGQITLTLWPQVGKSIFQEFGLDVMQPSSQAFEDQTDQGVRSSIRYKYHGKSKGMMHAGYRDGTG